MPSSPGWPAIVSIWAYFDNMKEHEEFEATTLDGVHYRFMKWKGQLWLWTWDSWQRRYDWEVIVSRTSVQELLTL